MYRKSVEEFTVIAAAKDPVPGGGGVSALCGALAASLAQMVTNLTLGKKKYAAYEEENAQLKERAEKLRISLLKGINEDAEAFLPLAEAYALPKDTEGYQERMEACLLQAASAPFAILKNCCEVIELDERLAETGSRLAVSDAATSAALAEGAMRGAYINVLVNTRLMKDRERAAEIEAEAERMLKEYSTRAQNCYAGIKERLSHG